MSEGQCFDGIMLSALYHNIILYSGVDENKKTTLTCRRFPSVVNLRLPRGNYRSSQSLSNSAHLFLNRRQSLTLERKNQVKKGQTDAI
jgi:hypothetical protein